ncbi:glycerate kinase, partial [Mycolicibacterium sp.]
MHVLIAPDKFKGTLTATEVADALQSGLTSAAAVTCATVPLADGGDGSVVAALSAGYTGAEATVTGPTGDPVHTRIAHHGGTAMVEVASSCG